MEYVCPDLIFDILVYRTAEIAEYYTGALQSFNAIGKGFVTHKATN